MVAQQLARELERVVRKVGNVHVQVERAVSGSDRRMAGRVRLWVPDALASIAMPAVAEFGERFPDVDIEFAPLAARPDVGRREADCGLFITDRPPEHLVGRSVGRLMLGAYGTREWSRRSASGEECRWVELEGPPELRCDLRQREFPGVPVCGRCHDLASQSWALRSGVGIGPLPCPVGDQDEALARIGAVPPLPGPEIWLLMHPDLRCSARVREMSRTLADAFGDGTAAALGAGVAEAAAG